MSLPLRFGPCWLDSVLSSGQSSLLFRGRLAHDDGGRAARALVVKIPYLYLQRSTGFRQVFHERMQLLSRVSHPVLVPLETAGRTNGLVWVVSPQVRSTDASWALAAIQKGGARPTPRQALSLVLRLCPGLAAMHGTQTELGPLIHGELRPEKVLFRPDGDPVLLMASAVSAAAGERSSASSAERFAWRAPEQLLRQPDTERTDVRGLALLLFVLLTGNNPFQRRTTARTCSAILQDQVLFESDSAISAELSALLRTAVSSDPDRRPPSVASLAEALGAELARLGGEESWAGWLEGLRARHPRVGDELRTNPERDALMTRLVRDAPRVVDVPEPARTEPARPVEVAPPPPPPPPPPIEADIDGEPTVMMRGRDQGGQRHTLIPEDHEPAPPRPVRIEQLVRRELPPEDEPVTTEIPHEVQVEWTNESTSDWTGEVPYEPTAERTAERTEDLPAPERRARRAARMLGTGVDSSFVLVTDDPTNGASSMMVAPEAAGQKEALPERLHWPPPLSESPEDDPEAFIPALSEEECLAELAREQAARAVDEDETEELGASLDLEEPSAGAMVQVRRGPDEVATRTTVTIPPPAPPAQPAPPEKPPAPPPPAIEQAPVHTMPTLVNQPSPTAPARIDPPESEETIPARAPVESKRATAPPRPTAPKPPDPEPEPQSRAAFYALLGLAAILIVAVGVMLGGPADQSGTPGPNPDPSSQGSQQAGTSEKGPSTSAPSNPENTANPENPVNPVNPVNPENPDVGAPPTVGASPGQETSGVGVTPPHAQQPAQTARTTEPTTGPPGLIALKADPGTDTRVDIRGTMRGPVPRPHTLKTQSQGPNGGDLYEITFDGVESQMKLTRINVNSALVSGVQIVSSPDRLTLLVNVGPGCSVDYAAMPGTSTFRIRVTRAGPG